MKDQNSILRKIKKLFELADDSKDKNEYWQNQGKLALEKAQELLRNYNISDDKFNAYNNKSKSKVTHKEYKYSNSAYLLNWNKILLTLVSHHNFCKILYYNRYNDCKLIGQPHNLEICEYLFEILRDQVSSICEFEFIKVAQDAIDDISISDSDKYRASRRLRCKPHQVLEDNNGMYYSEVMFNMVMPDEFSWKEIFCTGCVVSIRDTMTQTYGRLLKQMPKKSVELMVQKNKEVEEYMQDNFEYKVSNGKKINTGLGAFNQGVSKGKDINISKGVKTNSLNQKLL